ncbi:MAG TPA: hypothetical protein VHT27_14410 [Solirubrobacteraceae bacterium]|jgi:hypothetical protein|nr:hypothetical protein [Solirubrobacteraceae bacterium]
MPTFCRHNRFIERCPVCSKELELASKPSPGRSSPRSTARRAGGSGARRATPRSGPGMRVRHETRAQDDGYRCELVPGLRASADADRLADELAFAAGRLLALAADPPGLYGEIRTRAPGDPEGAAWAAMLLVYLCPTEGEDPFAAIRSAIALGPERGLPDAADQQALPDPDELELGPRSAHEPGRGRATLLAYLDWADRSGGQAKAYGGDPGWTPERRFERAFERLALPGFGRGGRYDLLVTLGRLGLEPVEPDSLHLGGPRGVAAEDPATAAAKRVFGIADPLLLDRRADALAEAAGVPLEALDLALANWAALERATLGMPAGTTSQDALEGARAALGL